MLTNNTSTLHVEHRPVSGVSEYLERCFVVFGFIIFSGAFIPLISTGGEFVYDVYSPAFTITLGTTLVITLLFSVPHMNSITTLLSRNIPLLLFLGYQFVSVFWAAEPMLTLRGATAALLTSIFAFYVVCRFQSGQYLLLLATSFAIILLGSVVFILLFPQLSYQPYSWVWRGVFINRNALGTYSALAGLVFLILLLSYQRYKLISLFFFLLSIAILYKSGSKTPLLGMIFCISIASIIVYIGRVDRGRAMVAALLAVMGTFASLLVLFGNPDAGFSAIGKESNFSGRTDAWQVIFDLVVQKPLLGHGTMRLNEEILAPHNMWLSTLLKSGVVGLILFIWFMVNGAVRAFLLAPKINWPGQILFPSLIIFIFFRGFMESIYFGTLIWVLLLIASTNPDISSNHYTPSRFYLSIFLWILFIVSISLPLTSIQL